MYKLRKVYGKKSYIKWRCCPEIQNLRTTQTDYQYNINETWKISSFPKLIECVAFLSLMNKRVSLFYRGQTSEKDPIPALFRDNWVPSFDSKSHSITAKNRKEYWEKLDTVSKELDKIFKELRAEKSRLSSPRMQGISAIREVPWAIIQHYNLWPTPLIDLTSSLRVAASFALNFGEGKEGFLYVVGMPNLTGSITFDIDQEICLLRLQSICPPSAKRPHYQDGFLVGRFQFIFSEGVVKSNLNRRVIAKFKLNNQNGKFWSGEFPSMSNNALMPKDDLLFNRFMERKDFWKKLIRECDLHQ